MTADQRHRRVGYGRAGDDGGWAPQSPLGPSPDRYQVPGTASIRKPLAAALALRRHPRVVRLANSLDRRGVGRRRRARFPQPREAADGGRRHRRCEIRPSGRRDAASPRSSAQQPSVVRSPQFGDHRRSRPRGRRDYRNRGIAITPTSARAPSLPVETNRPVKAVLAAQLKPDGSRSRLLSHRSRASTDAALHRHAGPADGRHGPRSAAAASPGEAVASSPRARALLQLVRSGRLVQDSGRFRSAGKRA